jgi:hypothetical protein
LLFLLFLLSLLFLLLLLLRFSCCFLALDNIFFYLPREVTALASETKQKIAALLLDFEKTYDRVDWNLLEGIAAFVILRPLVMFFLQTEKGLAFELSPSVASGMFSSTFPILFFADMSNYSTVEDTGLKGINIPLSNKEILESKFLDNTCFFC